MTSSTPMTPTNVRRNARSPNAAHRPARRSSPGSEAGVCPDVAAGSSATGVAEPCCGGGSDAAGSGTGDSDAAASGTGDSDAGSGTWGSDAAGSGAWGSDAAGSGAWGSGTGDSGAGFMREGASATEVCLGGAAMDASLGLWRAVRRADGRIRKAHRMSRVCEAFREAY